MRKWMSGLALAVAMVAAARVAQAQDRACGNDRIEQALAEYTAALRTPQAEPAAEKEKPKCDGTYGTAVSWLTDEKRAAEKARAEKKLVLVVHISGDLDDPEKT